MTNPPPSSVKPRQSLPVRLIKGLFGVLLALLILFEE